MDEKDKMLVDLLDEPEEKLPELRAPFGIRDERSATWLVGKICDMRARKEKIREQAGSMIAECERHERTLLYMFGGQLADFARSQLDGKTKSVKLLTGTVGFRKSAGRLEIQDESVVLEWARTSLPAAVKIVESVLKTPIIEQMKETGVLPEGCQWIEGKEEFYVK